MLTNKQAQTQREWRKQIELIDTTAIYKLIRANKDIDARHRIIIDNIHVLVTYKGQTEQNQLHFKRAGKFLDAINHPERLKGEVILEYRQENLFHARDGKILLDEINLTAPGTLEKARQLMENRGENIVNQIKSVLDKQLGQDTEAEITIGRFLVAKHPSRFLIRNKFSQQFVANDMGFTAFARSHDKVRLQIMPSYLQSNPLDMGKGLSEEEFRIVKDAQELLAKYAEGDKKGHLTFKSKNFYFSSLGGDLQVSRLDGSGMVFDNNGFTEIASDRDKRELGFIRVFLDHAQHNTKLERQLEKQREADYQL